MTLRTALGMMSGTSMDGIDIALIRTDGRDKVERGPSMMFPYDVELRSKLKRALVEAAGMENRDERSEFLRETERWITKLHVKGIEHFLEENRLSASTVDVIGFHGQTVVHRPNDGFTVQLGDGDLLAAQTGIPVVFDMRANDMAHGGQGAPLAPIYHQALAASLEESNQNCQPVMFINIGGISNITYVGEALIAFDAGPGNGLIDQWIEFNGIGQFDEGGKLASKGRVIQDIVNEYMSVPWFGENPRRSLDRGDFPPLQSETVSIEDGARTLARLTAESILNSAKLLPHMPMLWIVCGGGRNNPVIMQDLRELAQKNGVLKVITAEAGGFNGDSIEAEAWAYMAVRSLEGLPLTFPGTTGVSEPVSGGVYVAA